MVSVEEAWQLLESNLADFGTACIPIEDCAGRILREDIYADRDFPPFDRVAMDGIAVRFADIEKGIKDFSIQSMVGAGDAQYFLPDGHDCAEIMTGAILPVNADTVIPYEWIRLENGYATLRPEKEIKKGQNVHRKGTDRKQHEILIRMGQIIGSSEIAVMASVGKTPVTVSRSPKVLIASTGNELIPIDQIPLPHQIRRSNVYQLVIMLKDLGIAADTAHLDDDFGMVANALSGALKSYDLIVISGGISAGKFDFVPKAFEELGVEKFFYKVAQKPGKPFLFGRHRGGCSVFGIPGNPVSSYVCMARYILPWLRKCMRFNVDTKLMAQLGEDIRFTSPLTQFITVRLEQMPNAVLTAVPVKGHGSGDLTSLVGADGFVELAGDRQEYFEGEVVRVWC